MINLLSLLWKISFDYWDYLKIHENFKSKREKTLFGNFKLLMAMGIRVATLPHTAWQPCHMSRTSIKNFKLLNERFKSLKSLTTQHK